MKYNVTLYPICSVKVVGVDADNAIDAIRKAEASVNLYELFDNLPTEPPVEYAGFDNGMMDGYIVDTIAENGDEETDNWFYHDETVQTVSRDRSKERDRELLAALKSLVARCQTLGYTGPDLDNVVGLVAWIEEFVPKQVDKLAT
jgi:hypothetical protein